MLRYKLSPTFRQFPIILGSALAITIFVNLLFLSYRRHLSKQVTSPIPILITTPSSKATDYQIQGGVLENWNTYTEINQVFEFKYPKDWKEKPILLQGEGYTQEFKDKEGPYNLVFISYVNNNQITGKPFTSIDDFIDTSNTVKTAIDNQEAWQSVPQGESKNVNNVTFFSKDNKFIYILRLTTGDTSGSVTKDQINKGAQFFNQILSTFRFLDKVSQSPTPNSPKNGCVIGGCNREICAEEEMSSICIYNERFECYKNAVCEVQDNGKCGWTMDEELAGCLEQTINL
jgi:hypothetical protein